jgi:hypothetical protein
MLLQRRTYYIGTPLGWHRTGAYCHELYWIFITSPTSGRPRAASPLSESASICVTCRAIVARPSEAVDTRVADANVRRYADRSRAGPEPTMRGLNFIAAALRACRRLSRASDKRRSSVSGRRWPRRAPIATARMVCRSAKSLRSPAVRRTTSSARCRPSRRAARRGTIMPQLAKGLYRRTDRQRRGVVRGAAGEVRRRQCARQDAIS